MTEVEDDELKPETWLSSSSSSHLAPWVLARVISATTDGVVCGMVYGRSWVEGYARKAAFNVCTSRLGAGCVHGLMRVLVEYTVYLQYVQYSTADCLYASLHPIGSTN